MQLNQRTVARGGAPRGDFGQIGRCFTSGQQDSIHI
jgi:hypothetical protein